MINTLESFSKAKEIIASVKGKNYTLAQLKEPSIELAAILLKEAQQLQTVSEKYRSAELARMMDDPQGKLFVFTFTDQCFRSHSVARTADQVVYILKNMGISKFISMSQRLGLCLFKWFGRWLSPLFVPMVKSMLRQETSKVILPAEEKALAKHLAQRRNEGVRVNINHLGEMILGEEEAERRLNTYIKDLEGPDIEYISVKISTIFSQINPIAWDDTLGILASRLRRLYRTAKNNLYVHPNGTSNVKFVNLDMEEYRDLALTVDLFCRVLSEPEFLDYSAGIVLQAYLPDAYQMQQKLTEWSIRRHAHGGAPIKIRIVKGANLAMEQVEASLKDWPQAPYPTKSEVDANFKKMLFFGCQPHNAKAVHIGVGTHNLFDASLALLLRAQFNVEKMVNFEMLEGMADNMRRMIQIVSGDVLLYCPTAEQKEFQNAIAYLMRRLDENTAPDNFLRHLFGLKLGSKDWQTQSALFAAACDKAGQVAEEPRRHQDRQLPLHEPDFYAAFENEPDTDWSLHKNVQWAAKILSDWKDRKEWTIPLVVGGKRILPKDPCCYGFDPSRPKHQIYRYVFATKEQAEEALQTAVAAQENWEKITPQKRSITLAAIAQKLREKRDDLIGAMVADSGKTVAEADNEVSEAIDFVEYYRRNIEEVFGLEEIEWRAKGVVLVATPWNFPCSISVGGIIAALAAGNAVIYKPSLETVLVGWLIVQLMWEAGVDDDVLQFMTCQDDPIGSMLVKDPRVGAVILTGSTETARLMLNLRPGLDLSAETGGKNAIIVTGLADRDLAIKEIVTSTFGNAGQKCSACSLAILEAEVYDDPHFLQQLKDAVQSLPVGTAWDPKTKVNPLIAPPGENLKKGLTQRDDGEEWLLKPIQDPENPQLWSPGIIKGVKEGSFIHKNELFGPVLGLMRADNLTHALKLANGTPYGLTAGLQSLDPREQQFWLNHVEAGNCYVNRSITGAIVRRQPFGGCKESSFGRGSKAGGPNYVMQFMHAKERALPKERGKLGVEAVAMAKALENSTLSPDQIELWNASAANYAFYWNGYFSKDHDPSRIVGQDNILRYVPHKKITLRVNDKDKTVDVLRVAVAASTVGCELEISGSTQALKPLKSLPWPKEMAAIKLKEESEKSFLARVAKAEISRLRLLSSDNPKLLQEAHKARCHVQVVPVIANGRVELLNYLREISISIDYHRYGNLGGREGEKRKPIL